MISAKKLSSVEICIKESALAFPPGAANENNAAIQDKIQKKISFLFQPDG